MTVATKVAGSEKNVSNALVWKSQESILKGFEDSNVFLKKVKTIIIIIVQIECITGRIKNKKCLKITLFYFITS